jgi:dethiobiotin synthetase
MSSSKKNGFFITGTDTGVGKTVVACELLKKLRSEGNQTAALKPVASGCIETGAGLRNLDALQLQQAATLNVPYEFINPFLFVPPIAPHIAAAEIGVSLSVNNIMKACHPILTSTVDFVVVEGAGGWKTPLNEHETMADLARAIGFPVILVVGLRLGCINHSILTYESLKKSKVDLLGWVANGCEENMIYIDENINAIRHLLDIPLLWINPAKNFIG